MKVGIVVSIMLQAVQQLVYQSIGDKLDYDEVTAKIRSVVSNKVAMMEGRTPMDVGKIDHECERENMEDDVAAVSWSTQCFACGGWGHLRRECPSVGNDGKGGKAWGKGLGEKGKGKGLSTKGGQKGDSTGVKGSRKGGFKVVLDQDGSFIENKSTGERMEVRVKDDVELTNGESEVITLDSGAGVHVWPRGRCEDAPTMPKKEGLRMCAANGTPITNLGRKLIKFRGTLAAEGRARTSGFARQA